MQGFIECLLLGLELLLELFDLVVQESAAASASASAAVSGARLVGESRMGASTCIPVGLEYEQQGGDQAGGNEGEPQLLLGGQCRSGGRCRNQDSGEDESQPTPILPLPVLPVLHREAGLHWLSSSACSSSTSPALRLVSCSCA